MSQPLDMQAWKLGAIAIVLAVVLPTLIEITFSVSQATPAVA